MLGGWVFFFAAMPCCFFFIKMILTSIQDVLVTICTKHDEQKPHVFLFVCPPKFLEQIKPFSLRRIQKQRFSEPLQRVHSQLCLLRRQIHTTPFLPENTQGVFFWENEPKGKQSSWEINSRIQLSWLWEEEYNKTLLARQCWKDNVRRHGSSCRSVFVNRRLCQFGQKDAKVLTDYRFQVQYFWWKKSG